MRTIRTVRKELGPLLSSRGIDSSESDLIIAHALGFSLEQVLAEPNMNVTDDQWRNTLAFASKRADGHSLAAITGRKEFYGLPFKVTQDTLIPRPASELLVDLAIANLKKKTSAHILDIGTGSGNLIISIAKNSPVEGSYNYYASDISRRALAVAQENARTHRVPIRFFHSNLFQAISHKLRFDLIVANLPYLTAEQLREPTLTKEPLGALWGGSDGTDIYAKLLAGAPSRLQSHGMIILEIDPGQKEKIKLCALDSFPTASISLHQDLSGDTRAMELILGV